MTFGKEHWQLAKLAEITSIHGPELWAESSEDPTMGSRWHSIRAHFGLTSFGVNANEADEGEELIAAHDESEQDDQDELYFVYRGRARFALDGETVDADEGTFVCVGGHVRRTAWALQTPTVVLAIGGTPDRQYRVPDWDSAQ